MTSRTPRSRKGDLRSIMKGSETGSKLIQNGQLKRLTQNHFSVVNLLVRFHMSGKPRTLHFASQQASASQMYENRTIRYKKGRPCRCNRAEREVDSSGDFAPRPPRFNALVPVRKLGTGKTGSFADPASVPAPGSALGLLLSRALSSAQAEAIVAKRKRRGKQWSECVRRPTSGRLPRQEYGQPFNETALNPEGSVVQ
jgi:hypothetical protein